MSTDDTLTPSSLARLVTDKIAVLGDKDAAAYFGVKESTITRWRHGTTEPPLSAAQRVWDGSLACQTPELWHGGDKASVQILLPIYRDVHPLNHLTLMVNYKKYGVDKVNMIPKLRTLVEEARNDLAAKFLASQSEWCIMCDEDMVLPIGSAAALQKHGWNVPTELGNRVALERMMNHPSDKLIVGAMYRDRRTWTKVACARAFGSPQENARMISIMEGKVKDTGLEDAKGWVATGFIKIHRSVFERIEELARRPDSPIANILPPPGREKDPIGFFGRTSQFRGEDIAFGRRAEMAGVSSFVDTGTYCGHVGDFIA